MNLWFSCLRWHVHSEFHSPVHATNVNTSRPPPKHIHTPIPQHAHARVHPHGREDHPQAVRESNEQAHLKHRLAHVTPVIREGKEVYDCAVHDLPVHRQSYAPHPQRRHLIWPHDRDIDQQGRWDRRHTVPEINEESERFPILIGRVVERVRGPHPAPHPGVEQLADRERHHQVRDAGIPLIPLVLLTQIQVIALDVTDVQSQAYLAHGDEYVQVVEE